MIFIKAILIGLMGVTLCLANISGYVTDTGTTPITGATVILEKGGQTATSGTGGFFSISVSSAILPGNSKSLPNGLCARIAGDQVIVTTSEQSAVSITAFNLSGKALSTELQTVAVGTHTFSLPCNGGGAYLYRVKAGGKEVVLKGCSIDGVYHGTGAAAKRSSVKSGIAKQAQPAAAEINDVIAATMTGFLNYRCVIIGNSDASVIVIKMIANAGDVTDADGNVYQSVRIGNQVWTTENLRTTKYNDGTPIPHPMSGNAWSSDITPAYCFYTSSTLTTGQQKWGALYKWYAINTWKLAPSGWHVPSNTEWNILRNYLMANRYNYDGTTMFDRTSKSLSAKTDWANDIEAGTPGNDLSKNNRSGFSALPGGSRSSKGEFWGQGSEVYFWSASRDSSVSKPNETGAYVYGIGNSSWSLNSGSPYNKNCGFSVRLLRDLD